MALSIFEDKEHKPDKEDLKVKLGIALPWWNSIQEYVIKELPAVFEEWSFPGKKYGWSSRLVSKKRRIIYMIPCDGYFMVAFVFGKKATEEALSGEILIEVKEIIENARVYAEGRGFRLDVKSEEVLESIKQLVLIKANN